MSNSSYNGTIKHYFQYDYYHEFNLVCYYLLFITIPIGIIGNLVSILIFTRRALNQRTNTDILYTFLCIINLIRILIQACLKRWDMFLAFIIRLHFETENLIETLILQFFSWTQALISFDRFVIVFCPIKGARIMSKKRVLYSIMFGLFVFILCVNSLANYSICFINIYTKNVTYNNRTYFTTNKKDQDLLIVVKHFIKAFMEVYIPYFTIFVFDIIVIVRLIKSKRKTVGLQSRNNRNTRFTINTILIDLIYLIFNFPSTISNVLYLIYVTKSYRNPKFDFVLFVSFLFQVLQFVYSCFHFFIFVIFNRNFRSDFFSIGSKLILKIRNH